MTIKQLADDLGVSKVAINNRMTELNLKDRCTKVGNRLEVPEDVADLIRESFRERRKTEPASSTTKADVVQVLSELLAGKDNQIREKDEQIKSLLRQLEQLSAQNSDFTKIIQQNNYLLAGAMSGTDRNENERPEDVKTETVSAEQTQKKSFFSRFFR